MSLISTVCWCISALSYNFDIMFLVHFSCTYNTGSVCSSFLCGFEAFALFLSSSSAPSSTLLSSNQSWCSPFLAAHAMFHRHIYISSAFDTFFLHSSSKLHSPFFPSLLGTSGNALASLASPH